jgi:hypothetical protein
VEIPASAHVNGVARSSLPPPASAVLPKNRKSSVRQSKRLRKNPDDELEPPLANPDSPLKVRLALPPHKKRKASAAGLDKALATAPLPTEPAPASETLHVIPPPVAGSSRTPSPSIPDSAAHSPSSESMDSSSRPQPVSVNSKEDLLTLSKMRKLVHDGSFSDQKDEVNSFIFAEAPEIPNLSCWFLRSVCDMMLI